ncbi:MAG: hypothetical protein ACE5JX_19580 [Acidobacteriota bacterium]
MRRFRAGLIAILVCSCLAPLGRAQKSDQDLRKEIEALKRGQAKIQRQLQEIQQLLGKLAPTRPSLPDVKGVVFDLAGHPTRGSETARLTLIEFTDYQ